MQRDRRVGSCGLFVRTFRVRNVPEGYFCNINTNIPEICKSLRNVGLEHTLQLFRFPDFFWKCADRAKVLTGCDVCEKCGLRTLPNSHAKSVSSEKVPTSLAGSAAAAAAAAAGRRSRCRRHRHRRHCCRRLRRCRCLGPLPASHRHRSRCHCCYHLLLPPPASPLHLSRRRCT